jgi:UMF1 family MFS transporter
MARTALSLPQAVRAGAGDLAALARGARGHRNVLTYLLARMIFTDGLTAILVFSGLFAAGAMHWATLEMLAYGIILSIAAVAGGLLAGRLDDAVGPKTSLKLELGLLIIIEALALGMGRNRIIYQPWHGDPLWNGPMFTTLPELVFLGLGCIIAITVTAAYASSRTMLTRVAPPEQLGVFFGLYVLSGAATMWLGPLLIEGATRIGGTQALGLTPILGMLAVGWALLFAVRGGGPMR